MRIRDFLALACLGLAAARAAEWPSLRGHNGSGVSDAKAFAVQFGPERSVIWKTELPPGKSSPVVAAGRIFLTGHEQEKLLTLCLDQKTGKVLWRREIARGRTERRNALNDAAAPTPVTDGRQVFVLFSELGLVAYDLEGNEQWRVPLGPFESEHGLATSPILVGDNVIVVADVFLHSHIAAFHKKDGKPSWKTERRDTLGAYATPAVYTPPQGPVEIVVAGPFEVDGYSAATGEKLWWVSGLGHQPKSVTVIDQDTAYVNMRGWGGQYPKFSEVLAQLDKDGSKTVSREEISKWGYFARHFAGFDLNHDGLLDESEWTFQFAGEEALVAIRLGGRGDVTATHVRWKYKKSLPQTPAPLIYDGVLYLVRDGGIVTSLDPAGGQVLKQGRIKEAVEGFFSSPVAAEGKIYVSSESGKVIVLRAGKEWEKLAVNDLGEDIWATPALLEGRMYLRTQSALYCFQEKPGEAPAISAAPKPVMTPEVLASYAGEYRTEQGRPLRLVWEDGLLLWRQGDQDVQVVPIDTTSFRTRARQSVTLRFEREEDKVVAVTVEWNEKFKPRFQRVPAP